MPVGRMAPASPRGRSSVAAMPIIAEDDMTPPVVPDRSAARPFAASNFRTSYPSYSRIASVWSYSTSDGSDGTLRDWKLEPGLREGFRDYELIARRGGWYRLVMLTLITIGLVVGLSVGLTLGLKKRHSASDDMADPYSKSFLVGNYTFTAALSQVTTSCTTSPSTFRCYPYATYNPTSPSSSQVTFFWTISPLTGHSYTISSTPNPFAPNFTSIPLTLSDASTENERFSFNFTMQFSSIPTTPLYEGQTETATCWFNTTVMSVTLWTRVKADYPEGIAAVDVPMNGTAEGFAAWPYQVDVRQVQKGGAGVPDCRYEGGGEVSVPQEQGALGTGEGECGCFYRNYGLDSENSTAATSLSVSNRRAARTTRLPSRANPVRDVPG